MNIILIGGGHSHAIALKLFGKKPQSQVNLTLISDTEKTPYSGMLPGHIAGYYSWEETHIDLISLADFARTKLYLDKAIGLDLKNNQVICANHNPLHFDILSIDVGSTPNNYSIKGADKYAIPAKPVPILLKQWNQLLINAANYSENSLTISIVGGGAGGVELALNMQSRLKDILSLNQVKISIFQKGKKLLPSHNNWVQSKVEKILKERDIKVYLEANVIEILPHQVICESNLKIISDYIFLVTQASAPKWIKESGLETDNQGFILIKNTLQSLSHPHIFATGDIATIKNYPRPKAGVFAVRQGKPLYKNLLRISNNKSLINYIPQEQYLNLIGTGDKNTLTKWHCAIASWGNWGWESPLLWFWKDYLDRNFMNYINH